MIPLTLSDIPNLRKNMVVEAVNNPTRWRIVVPTTYIDSVPHILLKQIGGPHRAFLSHANIDQLSRDKR